MRLELKGIHKYFGPVHANDDVSLTVESGTIHGLVGENGAGKSTLMKVLSGFIHKDSGEILLDGRGVEFRTPAEAIRGGVGMLHQDPLDFPPLSVLDNFLLGREDGFLQNRALGLAERTFQQAIQYARETLGEHTFLLGIPFISYADLLREQNRFEDAIRYAEQGIAYCQVWQPVVSLDGQIALAPDVGDRLPRLGFGHRPDLAGNQAVGL